MKTKYNYNANNIIYNKTFTNNYHPLNLSLYDNVEIKVTQHNLIIKDFKNNMRIIIKLSNFVKENLNMFFSTYLIDLSAEPNHEKTFKINLIKNIMHFGFNQSSYVMDYAG
jgi:hypothetical protein